MVYIIPVILFTFGILRFDYLKRERGRLALWVLLAVYLIALAGFRYKLGSDTIFYMRDYELLSPLNKLQAQDFQKTRYNPGFIVLFSFFKMLSPEFIWFQLFQAAFINSVFFYFIYKNTKNIFFAGFLYYLFLFVFTSFLQLRDSFAIGIFLLAWPWFQQNKWLLWYLATLLALTFHLSAIIMLFLPLICLPGVRNAFIYGKRTWVIILGIILVAFFIYKNFFDYIKLISVTENMRERANAYSNSKFGGSIVNFTGVIISLVKYVLYPLLILYIINKNKNRSGAPRFNKLEAFVLINTYVVIFSLFVEIANRLTNYFFPFVIILLSDFIFSTVKIHGKKIRFNLLVWFIFFLPMISLASYTLVYSPTNRSKTIRTYMLYYPYSSYFHQEHDMDQQKAYRRARRDF